MYLLDKLISDKLKWQIEQEKAQIQREALDNGFEMGQKSMQERLLDTGILGTKEEAHTQSKLKAFAGEVEKAIGEDERIDIQSDFDKIDVPHLETDRYPGLDGVRQASRNLLRAKQRESLKAIKEKYNV